MSYDVHLEADLGGPELSVISGLEWNYTSNCAVMWRAAGADLAEFDGKRAGECAPVLAEAIDALEAEPAKFQAMNPSNGWGSYETLLPALRDLLAAFRDAPNATVVVGQ